MSAQPDGGRAGAGLARAYFIGFSLSLVLTIAPFIAVMTGALSHGAAVFCVFAAATLQMLVQLRFFLHVDGSRAMHWQFMSLLKKSRAAAGRKHLDDYMLADHELDVVTHQASQNHSAVKSVAPLIVQCRRFWYAYQHEGEITEGARAHMELAEGIATGNESAAVAGANQLLDYLEQFARRVIDK